MKTLKNTILIFMAAGLVSCGGKQIKKDIILTSESSIERAMDILCEVEEGQKIIDFLYENPIRLEYSKTPGLCHKLAFEDRRIYLPKALKKHSILLALAVARAAYVYRIYKTIKLEELISEEEELGALFQARIALQLNFVNDDFNRFPFAAEMKSEFCTYIMEGSDAAMRKTRQMVLSDNPVCNLPLETLETQRNWLEKIKETSGEMDFFQLLYNRDMEKVRKEKITYAQAMKNDARIRGLAFYDLYKFQRGFYENFTKVISDFEKKLESEIAGDAAWRKKNAELLQRARDEFSQCNLIITGD